MTYKILFVERKPSEFVSIERAFAMIAEDLGDGFEAAFQQVPYGNSFIDTLRNLLFFHPDDADIYHITGHIYYIALLFPRKNTVLSIMDVRFLYGASGLRGWLLKKLYLDWPVGRMRFVTAISEETRREIIRHTGCEENKVVALDLPLVITTDKREAKAFNAERPVILQVGTMENKNIPNLARALRDLCCELRVIGRLTEEQTAVLKENEIEFSNAFDLTDDEIRDEYRHCDIVSFVSLYEGFGLPIIEAQAMRKPVITSNVSPMPETAGNAAYLADPLDPASISEGIEKIINDSTFRDALIDAGLGNIKRFAPATVAAKYEELYKRILG